ncbi:MAG TPA: Smr/MutS family protein, partial [Candidatus Wallbacteria bacterium]|nr:Smr/MutS family protein [Candidatus Wallbacteria bacterium]
PSFKSIYSEIFRSIEPDGAVKDEASAKLASIRREISSLMGKVQSKLKELINKIKERSPMPQDYVTIREGRFVIPLPSSLQDRVKGIVHDYSQTRSTVFMEPLSIMAENNKLRELKDNEAMEISRIIASLNDLIRPEINTLISSFHTSFMLDMYCAIAAFAANKNCENVKVSMEGELEIINGRHPLLKDGVVPLNLKLTRDQHILILSGPNAGGKTVLLKSIGVFCLMVKAGIPVPADPSSVIPYMDKIFVDIGDSQSIAANLSTFSAHIKFLSFMVAQIKNPERTLVLLDELGSGSAPNYSSSIACAIIWHLSQKKVRSIITTHFSGVVNYAYSLPNAINGSLEFDVKNLKPTYRLLMGVPGASYAIHIAKNYGLQNFIINKAKEFLDKSELRYEQLISELITYSAGLKSDMKKVEAELKSIDAAEAVLAEREKKFDKTRDEIEEAVREEYEKKYKELLKKVNSIGVKSADDIKKERVRLADEINAEKKSLFAPVEKPRESQKRSAADEKNERDDFLAAGAKFRYSEGDLVSIEKLNLSGYVKEIDVRKRQAKIEFKNKMQMWIKFSMISGTDENVKDFEGPSIISYKPVEQEITMELDMRGMNCEDGIAALERYLIKASERHFDEVRIIHGKGTLTLKSAVENYLRKCGLVRSFRGGKIGEGDYGVTLVELKK